MKNFKIILLAFFAVACLSGALWGARFVLAQATPGEEVVKQLQEGAGAHGANLPVPRDPRLVVATIIRAALGLLGMIFLALIVYAGFLWMTAGGNEENVTKAKSYIFNGVIGLIIIMSAYAITIYAFRIGLSSQGVRCTDSGGCSGGQKCNLYGMCVSDRWCQSTDDCANLGRNYVCRNSECTTAQDLGNYFTQ